MLTLGSPLNISPYQTCYHYRQQTKFAKVIFLHLSVSHSVHKGMFAFVHDRIHIPQEQTPPREQTPPPRTRHPPGSRHPRGPDTPEDQTPTRADTNQEQTPPRSRHNPCAFHAGISGQQAGGTQPTGMHTCLFQNSAK